MDKIITITEYFEDVETTREYNGYFCSVAEAITIVILGSICGLKNISQIHQWAASDRVNEFLREKFRIENIPCYYWLLCLLKLIKPDSLNECFSKWVSSILPKNRENFTISLDGKTIRSTGKMRSYEHPLHIVSAQISELGMTFAQKTVSGKSNEIPAVQELIEQLEISGCMLVADALNCQKKTAEMIIKGKGDYLLCVKDNQETLKKDIEAYIHDTVLQKNMKKDVKTEKNRGRIEKRIAYVTENIEWLESRKEWRGLKCIGAIHTEIEDQDKKTSEWHYYISSRNLTAEELLHHARMEWSVESMHWLLDVHFEEDYCRVENKNVQQNLNMLRKLAINIIKQYKERSESKRAISKIMFDCLLDPSFICSVIFEN